MAKAIREDAILAPGTPGCVHHEDLKPEEEYGGHIIGRCRYCPRVIDYSVAQATPDDYKKMLREKSRRGQAVLKARRREAVKCST